MQIYPQPTNLDGAEAHMSDLNKEGVITKVNEEYLTYASVACGRNQTRSSRVLLRSWLSMSQHGCFHFSIVALCAFFERFFSGPRGFREKNLQKIDSKN